MAVVTKIMNNHLNRREVLKALSASGALTSTALSNLSFGAQDTDLGCLVVVFLRGGADSLQMAAPVDNPDYIAARTANLRILESGETPGLLLPKAFSPKEDCRLHASAAPLFDLFQSGHADLLHACGLSFATRSHFESQDLLDSAINAPMSALSGNTVFANAAAASSPVQPASSSAKVLSDTPGWLTPFVKQIKASAREITTLNTTSTLSRSLKGLSSTLGVSGDIRGSLNLPGDSLGRQVLEALYPLGSGVENAKTDPTLLMGRATLNQFASLESRMPKVDGRFPSYSPPKDVKYNFENHEWIQATQAVAQLIRLDIGLRVATVDLGGWDTHEYQGGRINNLIRQWSTNLRALFDDLQAANKNITFLVVSEFGRRVRANNSNGTDHGHAGIVWCLDSRKRKLLPQTIWPGLAIEQLDQGLDLASTVDVKLVLNSVAQQTLSS